MFKHIKTASITDNVISTSYENGIKKTVYKPMFCEGFGFNLNKFAESTNRASDADIQKIINKTA